MPIRFMLPTLSFAYEDIDGAVSNSREEFEEVCENMAVRKRWTWYNSDSRDRFPGLVKYYGRTRARPGGVQ